jgi:hypothetical protein
MREPFAAIVKTGADHPVIAISLTIYFGIALILGLLHEARFLGECVLVGIRFFNHEMRAWSDLLQRLKRELTTRKHDP